MPEQQGFDIGVAFLEPDTQSIRTEKKGKDMSEADLTLSRIAIKLGPPAAGRATPSQPIPPSTLGKRSRSRILSTDSDSEEGDETTGAHQTIVAVTVDGATGESARDASPAKPPPAIPRQPNRDWKAELCSRRIRSAANVQAPADSNSGRLAKGVEPSSQSVSLKYGLSVKVQASGRQPPVIPQPSAEEDSSGNVKFESSHDGTVRKMTAKSADEEALDALVGGAPDVSPGLPVIHQPYLRVTEHDAFQRDFRNAPDASTLEQYDAMPVEQFGEALLRGMGWDGKRRGPKVKEAKRRPNQMGLGAKELKEQEDLGSWNQGATGVRPRPSKLTDYRRQVRESHSRGQHASEDRRRDESYKEERDRERRERTHADQYSSRRR